VSVEDFVSFSKEFNISPSHIIRETLSSFVDAVSPDDIYASVSKEDDSFFLNVRATLYDDSGREQKLTIEFVFNRKDKSVEVEHIAFILNKENQGNGLSRKVMKEALDLYQSIGVSEVTLLASLANGPYVWAKYGFVPEDSAKCRALAESLSYSVSDLPELFPPGSQTHKELSGLIEELKTDPKALWGIAGYSSPVADSTYIDPTTKKPMKAGKALLLKGADLYGKADLTDPLTVNRWKGYCNTVPNGDK